MKRLPLILIGFILLGCSASHQFSVRTDNGRPPADQLGLSSDRKQEITLSPEDQLGVVFELYRDALDSVKTGNNPAAQGLYEGAILNLAQIEADSLGMEEDDLDWLRMQLVNDYAQLLSKMPELPAESSPEAVYFSLSEFLGDTVNSREDLIDMLTRQDDLLAVSDTPGGFKLYPDVPLVINPYVENALNFFQTRGRKVFTRWLERSAEAIPYYTSLLKEEGLPEEVVYLSMIESGFNTSAYSYAHASGPWQFIKGTAKIYGLNMNNYLDERRDPEKATRAACRYLRKLYDQFGDWYLAFASYNCGEGRVEGAVNRSGKKDYWEIRSTLPNQTREYVPLYLAARIISEDPQRYGFPPIATATPVETAVVYVDGSVSLKEIARAANVDYETIKQFNPALKKGCTPPNSRNHPVRIPKSTVSSFNEQIAQAPRLKSDPVVSDDRGEWVRHRVRSGETLGSIASKYGTSTKAIMDVPANKLRNPHKLSIGKPLLIPVGNTKTRVVPQEPQVGSPQPPQLTTSSGLTRTIYRVRRGDILANIASQYAVNINDIKTWNHIWGKRHIYPGQKLIIWTKAGDAASETDETVAEVTSNPSTGNDSGKPRIHMIRSGDTLWNIARHYGLSVQDLKKWNDIHSAYRLQPGAALKLEP
ncbi:MAG: LysM peptidoglycan-binding domain-containing protein [bacterium]|nr:LysM peptidoglycan-binding domain-containing protein [bacterium]